MGLFVFSGGCWADTTTGDSWIKTAEATVQPPAENALPAFPSLDNPDNSKGAGKGIKLSSGSSQTASGMKKTKGTGVESAKKEVQKV